MVSGMAGHEAEYTTITPDSKSEGDISVGTSLSKSSGRFKWMAMAMVCSVIVVASGTLEGCTNPFLITTTSTTTKTSTTQTVTTTTITTSVTTTITTTTCCWGESAECLACKAETTLGAYCGERENWDVEGCADCGVVEDGYDYPGGDLREVWGLADHHECCQACRDEILCTAWTFTQNKSLCMLRSHVEFHRTKKEGYVSGLPGGDTVTAEIRSVEGKCLGNSRSGLNVSHCEEQWLYDLRTGQIETKGHACLRKSSSGDKAQSTPCTSNSKMVSWDVGNEHGHVKTSEDKCLSSSLEMQSCDEEATHQKWTLMPANNLPTHTLFCISLMVPWTHEKDLLSMQHEKGYGIFACEGFAVYSNSVIDLGSGLHTRQVHGTDLRAPICGKYHTVCNTKVFAKVWQQVIKDADYLKHDWTVKVDPDAVFFADRLHKFVNHLPETYEVSEIVNHGRNGLFLNNCPYGFHGPLETMSRRAMQVFAANDCCSTTYATEVPQEDVYLQKCMMSLGVSEIDEFKLLAEKECYRDHWHKDPLWMYCTGDNVAFHPFKTAEAYVGCFKNATGKKMLMLRGLSN